jgi:hypothetical protein
LVLGSDDKHRSEALQKGKHTKVNPNAPAHDAAANSSFDSIKRRHLFELHDLPWWPKFLRQSLTDVLILAWGFPWITFRRDGARLIPSLASLCARVLRHSPIRCKHDSAGIPVANDRWTDVVDLCSGSGGPWNEVLNELKRADLRVTLTDLHPPDNAAALTIHSTSAGFIKYYPDSINAMNVPAHLNGRER